MYFDAIQLAFYPLPSVACGYFLYSLFLVMLLTLPYTLFLFLHSSLRILYSVLQSYLSSSPNFFPDPSPFSCLKTHKKRTTFVFSLSKPTESNWCCPYTHRYPAFHWSVVNPSRATSLKKTDCPSPAATKCQSSSVKDGTS